MKVFMRLMRLRANRNNDNLPIRRRLASTAMVLANPIVHRPFTFDIGPLTLTGFGIAVLLALVIAQIVSERELARRGHDKEAASVADLMVAVILGTIVGGKLYYVLVVTHRMSDLWSRSGLVFWGGFMGSVLFVW